MSLSSCLASSFAPPLPLGERRGVADLALFALDLSRDRAEPDRLPSARGDYPSPPMSGSPSNPPKINTEAGDPSQGTYQQQRQEQQHRHQLGSYDAFGVAPTSQRLEVRGQYPGSARSHGSETPSLPFSRRQDSTPRQSVLPFPPPSAMPQPLEPPQQSRQLQPTQAPYLPAPAQPMGPAQGVMSSASSSQPTFAMQPQPGVQENQPYTSPKTQRKTKGHVASACVPCKKAHLRCDSQRPCSRCMTSGKDEVCVDVQHKKRGRPRLRDDKDSRFDPRYPNQPDMMRRAPQLSLYTNAPMPPVMDDPLRRGPSSYRVIKSQPTEPIQPRYLDRASTSDANILPPRLSISTSVPEPIAFLTMDFVIKSASSAFADAIGVQPVVDRDLLELVSAKDREKVKQYQKDIQTEREKQNPTYLPPIYRSQSEDSVIKSLAFSREQLSKITFNRTDTLIFQAPDGQQRSYAVQVGLGLEASIYYVVLVLNTSSQAPPSHPFISPSSSQPSSTPYSYQAPHQALQHPTPMSASFETARMRYGEGGYGPDPSPSPRQPGPMTSGLSPGIPPFSSRPDNAPSYHIPRSELAPLTGSSSQQASFRQLPPILGQARPSPSQLAPNPWSRDERYSSMGGDMDKPETKRRQ